ncbi:hypothetical protein KJZ61_02905 [Candidatus Dependentiae bacterium]|nr:hypothetical protein [Candidatus Dependentiae bacterium]
MNRIATQTNALETKLDTITTSIGSGLSTKVDRINNNMMIPITAAGTISTAGSYILANDIAGNITVSGSDISIDFNQYKITGQLIITAGVSRLDFYNGIIESSSGPCVAISTATDKRFVALDNLVLRMKDTSTSAINLPSGSFGDNFWIKNCIIIGSSQASSGHQGIDYAFGDTEGRTTIENCIITNFFIGVRIQVNSPTPVTMRNCLVMECGTAISVSINGQYQIITNNLLKDNGAGISLAIGVTRSFVFGNVITGCTSTSAGAVISNSGGSTNQIYGNFAYNNAGAVGTRYSGVSAVLTSVAGDTSMYANISL